MMCWDMTESTLICKRLNSSKHTQEPLEASPLKNLVIESRSMLLWQLNTKQCLAVIFDSSFIDSVLPVPTGPTGAPPYKWCRAKKSD